MEHLNGLSVIHVSLTKFHFADSCIKPLYDKSTCCSIANPTQSAIMSTQLSVGNLLLDTGNPRIVKQDNQKQARDAIISEQGKKLVVLAQDIIENGLNPADLPIVYDAADGNNSFIILEGNRRLTAIQLMLTPDLAEGTPIHGAFRKLNKLHADSIPKVMDCVVVPNRKTGAIWFDRKHATGLEGAGTEKWSAMAQARADAENGLARPELDAVNFVLTNPALDAKVRKILEGSEFNITSLKRLVESKDVQVASGFLVQDGKLISEQPKERIHGILMDITTVIASGKKPDGTKFTVRDIDSKAEREQFIDSIIEKHPKRKNIDQPWRVAGKPVKANVHSKGKTKTTHTTDEQPNLIPRKFKLELPSGKINDIFTDLKELDVTKRRHAVSVLFRVFFELSLHDYITKHGVQLPLDKSGHVKDSLLTRLTSVVNHVKSTNLLTDKELKPISVAVGDRNSVLAPETLNSYVHSAWMNPDPLRLKLAWADCQLFLERLWTSKK